MPFIDIYSANRDDAGNSTDTNFTFTSDKPVKCPAAVRLAEVLYANTFYNVTQSLGDSFFISVAEDDEGTGSEDYSVVVNDGFYDIDTLIATIINQINAEITPLTFNMSINAQTSKVSCSVTGKYLKIYGNPTSTGKTYTLNTILGFSRSQDSGFALAQTAGRNADVQRIKKAIIVSDIVGPYSFDTITNNFRNVLGEIPIANISFQGYNFYQNYSTVFLKTNLTDLSSFSIKIYDDEGNILNSNGIPISIKLEYL